MPRRPSRPAFHSTEARPAPRHRVARRRVQARARARARRSSPPDILARLVDLGELTALLHEVSRTAGALAGAAEAELVLWRAPVPRRPRLPGRRSTMRAALRRSLERVRGGHPVVVREHGAATGFLPLGRGRRSLGCVRLAWSRPPDPQRLAAARGYLDRAAAAVARLLAIERLRRQQHRHEALLASLPDACLVVLSPAGSIVGVHGHAAALTGYDPSALLGQPLATPEARRGLVRLSRARWRQLLATARRGGRAEIETRLRSAGRDVEVSMTLLVLGTGELVCVLRDLTEVKAMERALLRRNEELTQAAERLKEIDVLKNEFLSNVSHELRTPLTAIIAYSEALIMAPPEPETQREFLRVVAEQGHKLQRLIAGLLDIAKLESLATELKLQSASLNDIVQAAVVTVQPLADKSRIRIATALEPNLPKAFLDELRAQQIVWNLLTNAIKFSPSGSTVHVRTWSADEHVWASVRDEGIGISPEHHKLIFEKFVQLDGSTTRRHGGVGLGLDLVRHLVDLHGGRVGVDSAVGMGSTFTFSIPIEKRRKARLGGRLPVTAAGARGAS